MTFSSLEEAKQFERNHADYLASLESEAKTVADVLYTEVWLNGNSPSFVAGFNASDETIVSFPISVTSLH